MKRTLLMMFVLLISTICYSQVHVKGYYKSNGTYVQPHERTPPNNTVTDNYSYPGNYNPNTGKVTGGSTYNNSSSNSPPQPISKYRPTQKLPNQNYNPPANIKVVIPKTVPHEERNYMTNPKGEVYGYSYCPETKNIYKSFFVYDIKGVFIFFINKYPDGMMYAYNEYGQFVTAINGK